MSRFNGAAAALVASFAVAAVPVGVSAAPSHDACAGRFIDSVPAVITSPGTWCLRRNLGTAIASGAAIDIRVSNVTLDCNDHMISGLAAGRASQATGIVVGLTYDDQAHTDLAVRRCHVRGFASGIEMYGSGLVEDNRVDGSLASGIYHSGRGEVRRNLVTDTGGTDQTYVAAIGVRYNVDVLGNTIDGVVTGAPGEHGARAWGIRIIQNQGGSVRGNRIRGLDSPDSVVGIVVIPELWFARVLIADNHVSTLVGTGGIGVECLHPEVGDGYSMTRDNALHGFETPVLNCTAGGGDVVLP